MLYLPIGYADFDLWMFIIFGMLSLASEKSWMIKIIPQPQIRSQIQNQVPAPG